MPFLEDLKDRFETVGVGVFNTNIFISSSAIIPVGSGPYLVLIDTGGSGSAKTQNNTGTERPTAQLSTRATNPLDARAMLVAAYQALGGVNGLFNVVLSGTPYLSITSRQSNPVDAGLDGTGKRALYTLNIDVEKGPDSYVPPPPPGPAPAVYIVVDYFGGTSFGFVNPSIADGYPSGATFDKLVPGSNPILLNGVDLYTGPYYLEASARVDQPGGRVKLALFCLTDAPDSPITGSEIAFTSGELIGESRRSGGIVSLPSGSKFYGIKMTTDNVNVAGAVWGARLLRI